MLRWGGGVKKFISINFNSVIIHGTLFYYPHAQHLDVYDDATAHGEGDTKKFKYAINNSM